MIHSIVELIAFWIVLIIQSISYPGITLLMALESANIPIPSEVIMPFSGFLVAQGVLAFWGIVVAGTIGNLLGSLASYSIGYWGGIPFLKKWGRFLFIDETDLAMATRLFDSYGPHIVFFSRMIPIVRTFISLPAGIARMNIWKFALYTTAGALLWSVFLAYIGVIAGEHWTYLQGVFHKLDAPIVVITGVIIVWWVARHIIKKRKLSSI